MKRGKWRVASDDSCAAAAWWTWARPRPARAGDAAARHTSPNAIVADKTLPASAATLHQALVETWPRLAGRVAFIAQPMDDVELSAMTSWSRAMRADAWSDVVIDRASAAGARVAVLPCCHDLQACETGELEGWVDGALAIDIMRAGRLRTQAIACGRSRSPWKSREESPSNRPAQALKG